LLKIVVIRAPGIGVKSARPFIEVLVVIHVVRLLDERFFPPTASTEEAVIVFNQQEFAIWATFHGVLLSEDQFVIRDKFVIGDFHISAARPNILGII
jgi:hypothetical protein